MMTLKRVMACLALTMLVVPPLCSSALAQNNNRPQIDSAALRGLRDMNDPGNGGLPLPPPANAPVNVPAVNAPDGGTPPVSEAVAQMCQKLKAAGTSPGYCK